MPGIANFQMKTDQDFYQLLVLEKVCDRWLIVNAGSLLAETGIVQT